MAIPRYPKVKRTALYGLQAPALHKPRESLLTHEQLAAQKPKVYTCLDGEVVKVPNLNLDILEELSHIPAAPSSAKAISSAVKSPHLAASFSPWKSARNGVMQNKVDLQELQHLLPRRPSIARGQASMSRKRRIHAKHAPGKFFELEASPRCYGYGKEKASGRSGACKTVSRVSKKIVEQSSGVSFFDHPVAPSYALSCYKDKLSRDEQEELDRVQKVYFIGKNKPPHTVKQEMQNGEVRLERLDGVQLQFRYEAINVLGKGSFGQVWRCIDHKNGRFAAVKLVSKGGRLEETLKTESQILKKLKHSRHPCTHIINIYDTFLSGNYSCMVLELLGMDLYKVVKLNDHQPLHGGFIREVAQQLMHALSKLEKHGIIHCDIKPENILLVKEPILEPSLSEEAAAKATKNGFIHKAGLYRLHSAVKLADFGSSCFEQKQVYQYIQSRYYRAPEVILGHRYTTRIDMWSSGCVLAELRSGTPLFQANDRNEHLSRIAHVLGPCPYPSSGANDQLYPREQQIIPFKLRSTQLEDILPRASPEYIDFLEGCLTWKPEDRFGPSSALQHRWITGEL